MDQKTDVDLGMRTLLTEFQVLKSEIQYRSDYQNRYLNFHITALTAILSLFISQLNNPYSHWIILLIPFEAVFFGFLFADHIALIHRHARYLRRIELLVNHLVGTSKLMNWEVDLRTNIKDWPKKGQKGHLGIPPGSPIRGNYTNYFFLIPAFLIVLVGIFRLVLLSLGIPEAISLTAYSSGEWPLAALVLLLEIIPLGFYWRYTHSIWNPDKYISKAVTDSVRCIEGNDPECKDESMEFFFGSKDYFQTVDKQMQKTDAAASTVLPTN